MEDEFAPCIVKAEENAAALSFEEIKEQNKDQLETEAIAFLRVYQIEIQEKPKQDGSKVRKIDNFDVSKLNSFNNINSIQAHND